MAKVVPRHDFSCDCVGSDRGGGFTFVHTKSSPFWGWYVHHLCRKPAPMYLKSARLAGMFPDHPLQGAL